MKVELNYVSYVLNANLFTVSFASRIPNSTKDLFFKKEISLLKINFVQIEEVMSK